MPTTILNIPPKIAESFSGNMLSFSCAKFYDDCETIWSIYLFIREKLKHKTHSNQIAKRKTEKYCESLDTNPHSLSLDTGRTMRFKRHYEH